VSISPVVNDLRSGEAQALSDLGGTDELSWVDLPFGHTRIVDISCLEVGDGRTHP
jgi:hypothetical protein